MSRSVVTQLGFLIAGAIVFIIVLILALAGSFAIFGVEDPAVLSIREIMWFGSGSWAVLVLTLWIIRSKRNTRLWFVLVCTFFGLISALGLYIPFFTTFALWLNAILWILTLIVILWLIPE